MPGIPPYMHGRIDPCHSQKRHNLARTEVEYATQVLQKITDLSEILGRKLLHKVIRYVEAAFSAASLIVQFFPSMTILIAPSEFIESFVSVKWVP